MDTYEEDLAALATYVQSRHPLGAVKHIGLHEAVPAAIELIENSQFTRHLDDASRIISQWPAWKQQVLGGVSRQPDGVTLEDWLAGRKIKTITIVRRNGRIGPATRNDMPMLGIVIDKLLGRGDSERWMLNNQFLDVGRLSDDRKNWQLVIVTATGRKTRQEHA